MTETFFGKYRGKVVDNEDPLALGRVRAVVPDVGGEVPLGWALPCFPVAGPQCAVMGVPPIGAGVWIEFERGDPDLPIWTGCFFESPADLPSLHLLTPPGVFAATIETQHQCGITVTDLPGPEGGIVLKAGAGASLVVNDAGIHIKDGRGGSINVSRGTVSVNDGALTIP